MGLYKYYIVHGKVYIKCLQIGIIVTGEDS